tara:strand:- start:498 stop:629 length:132 start_codon:yes stop_codon:yes gene_type:complete
MILFCLMAVETADGNADLGDVMGVVSLEIGRKREFSRSDQFFY